MSRPLGADITGSRHTDELLAEEEVVATVDVVEVVEVVVVEVLVVLVLSSLVCIVSFQSLTHFCERIAVIFVKSQSLNANVGFITTRAVPC